MVVLMVHVWMCIKVHKGVYVFMCLCVYVYTWEVGRGEGDKPVTLLPRLQSGCQVSGGETLSGFKPIRHIQCLLHIVQREPSVTGSSRDYTEHGGECTRPVGKQNDILPQQLRS